MDNQRERQLEREQQKREHLKRLLEGYWEYVCRVTSSTPFEDDKWGRGGIMTINVTLEWAGVTPTIIAERLWVTTNPDDIPGDRIPLVRSKPWNADGSVTYNNDQLVFEYVSGEGRGMTKDRFVLRDDNELVVGPGTFKHRRPDGQDVEGTVQLRKMRHIADFEWAPRGINPATTVVQASGLPFEGKRA
jgi:hypothetical protein